MRIQQLELLLAVERTGSLTAAAEVLCVSQPAVTKMLRSLEEDFGTPLAVRNSRGIRLTPAGQSLAARAASMLRELQRARDEVAWHQAQPAIQVSVGASPAAAILLLPGAADRLRQRWPQVRLKVVDANYPQALTQVRNGELDIAVVPLPDADDASDLTRQPLFENAVVIVAHRTHPLAGARSLAALSTARWVLTGPVGGFGDPVRLPFAARGLAVPPVCVECQSFSTLLALLPRADLVGVLRRRFFELHAPHYDLVALPIEEPLPTVAIHAIVRADAVLTPPARLLLDALVHEAAGIHANA
ncbi:LysR family transcriptional regulator [Achromobacter sp. GG226]|uniref:LysR family transcriptional regulator n=1 Tax=Verticiella alkaliphila TaxID=2779529 RepID=UPI001C0D9F87|nr:LysR substrate-binding domain-containing protein [Verticiella sp. GG226]MBU4612702.1 LysR family transcriptional regulator [Verticiella sp. GG226]